MNGLKMDTSYCWRIENGSDERRNMNVANVDDAYTYAKTTCEMASTEQGRLPLCSSWRNGVESGSSDYVVC